MQYASFPLRSCLPALRNANYENRPLAKLPEFINEDGLNLSFPSEFDEFFEDNFALREHMVTAFNAITMSTLNDTVNEKTVIGKDGWLFYAESMDDYLGQNVLSDTQILRAAKVIKLQQEYLESKGIKFAFTIAPNKATIYPEKMADRYVKRTELKNLDKLKVAMNKLEVNYIDLKKELLAAKSDEEYIYYKEDTHWNDLGALVAYRAIMANIASGVNYDEYKDIAYTKANDYGGDVHYFVLPSVKGGEERIILDYKTNYKPDRPVNLDRDVVSSTTSSVNDFRLIMFRDSFGKALFPLIASNVGRAYISREFPYNMSYIEKEQPNAVVAELVERNIPWLIDSAPNMPAIKRGIVGAMAEEELGAKAYAKVTKNEIFINGYIDPDKIDHSKMSIYISLSNGETFEAFPILDAENLRKKQ